MSLEDRQANQLPVHKAENSGRSRGCAQYTGLTYVAAQPPPGNDLVSPLQTSQLAGDVVSFPRHGFMLSPDGSTTSTSSGEESMLNHGEDAAASRLSDEPEHAPDLTTANLGRLSLDQERSHQLQDIKGAHCQYGSSNIAPKRAASSTGCSRRQKKASLAAPEQRIATPAKRTHAKSTKHIKQSSPSRGQKYTAVSDLHHVGRNEHSPKVRWQPYPRDSGYDTQPSRSSTLQAEQKILASHQHQHVLSTLDEKLPPEPRSPLPITKDRSLTMIPQPKSSPISPDQLAAEVRGIYAGLRMVEGKCINIDAAQAKDPNSKLDGEQWQALIALHRTLLYEHHDFLMATQHPSATPSLKELAHKYSMPARMWRHGIHAFLELLRHRRPESQEFMLAFICLAYQMMCLLFETVKRFESTWIECLGDLARYRMAVEDEAEARFIWGGVAGRWYHLASDMQPATGRLYHHLGILERPSLRKFFLYAKSLTCVVPFPNAKDSLTTLCTPIAQEKDKAGLASAEASIVTFYALNHSGADQSKTSEVASIALLQLSKQSPSSNRDFRVELVVSNAAVLLEQGSPRNIIWQHFARTINNEKLQPPTNTSDPPLIRHPDTATELSELDSTTPSLHVTEFCYSAFNIIIRAGNEPQSLCDALPPAHVVLVWLCSLTFLQSGMDNERHTYGSLLISDADSFSWGGLSELLNIVAQVETIGSGMIDFAHRGEFLPSERLEKIEPLPEDYLIQGLIWTQFCYPEGFFPEEKVDNDEKIDEAAVHRARCRRVLFLGLYLAFRVAQLNFDIGAKCFYAPLRGALVRHTETGGNPDASQQVSNIAETSTPRSSVTLSTHSDSDGYGVVKPRKRHSKSNGQAATKPTKRRSDYSAVKILDEEGLQCE